MRTVVFKFFLSCSLMYSCMSDHSGTAELKRENDKLKSDIKELQKLCDSLQSIPFVRDSLRAIPYIENMRFKTKVDKPYYMQLLTIIPKDIVVDSLFINGEKIDLEKEAELINISYNEYGPRLEFQSSRVGVYDFKAYARFGVWDNKSIPLSWPIRVEE